MKTWLWVPWVMMVGGCFKPALPQDDVEVEDGDFTADDGDGTLGEIDDATTADSETTDVIDGSEVREDIDDVVDVVDVEEATEVIGLEAPQGVTASLDRNTDVEVTWRAVVGATGYLVVRCDPVGAGANASCDNEVTLNEGEPVDQTRFVDETARVPELPAAATVRASRDLAEVVVVDWDPVVAPAAFRHRYQVFAVDSGGVGPGSVAVLGGRAERPVVGYELKVDDGAWAALGEGGDPLGTSWTDVAAGAPRIEVGEVSASAGVYAEFVRLVSAAAMVEAGGEHVYRVRAVTAYGNGAEGSATGWRVAGSLGYQWERSAGSGADSFAEVLGASGLGFDDAGAPADGAVRWYRLRVEAEGAETLWSAAVAGSRQPPPGVPGNVRATGDLPDHVSVSWNAVSGAIGYHVYREGVRLTDGAGVTQTTYIDAGAPAPSATYAAPVISSASTNQTDKVVVTWTAPIRPLGAEANYQVLAVNAAGEGPLSTGAKGARAAPAIVGYDVQVTPSGGSATWISTGSTATTWDHVDAPRPTINGGSIAVTQGAHRNFVRMSMSGATTSPGTSVGYRVRGVLFGGAYTPTSTNANGRRSAGALTTSWQRSAGSTASNFSTLGGAIAVTSFDDTTAPGNGDKRWYQALLVASGAEVKTVGPADGWRLAFVSVDGGGLDYGSICGLTSDGTFWCWGFGGEHLGRGSEPISPAVPMPGEMPSGTVFLEIDGTRMPFEYEGFWNCARSALDIWCWGNNWFGQLGDGTVLGRGVPTRVSGIAAAATSMGVGGGHACAVHANGGRVQCWGNNEDLQLGRTTTNSFSMVPVTVQLTSGSDLLSVAEVKAGAYHSCARRTGGTVACWGENSSGQLGSGVTTERVVMTVPGLVDVVEMWLGFAHGCARLQDGTVKCWGDNTAGQLGDRSTTSRSAPVTVFGVSNAIQLNESCARTNTGAVWCWGGDFGSTAVQWPNLTGASWVGSGYHYERDPRCVIVNGGIRCWRRPSEQPYDIELP